MFKKDFETLIESIKIQYTVTNQDISKALKKKNINWLTELISRAKADEKINASTVAAIEKEFPIKTSQITEKDKSKSVPEQKENYEKKYIEASAENKFLRERVKALEEKLEEKDKIIIQLNRELALSQAKNGPAQPERMKKVR